MEEKTVSKKKKKKGSLCGKGVAGLYVCAGLSLLCGIYMLYYSITYVKSYYASYGMSISDGIKDVIQYVISNTGSYVGFAILLFAAAIILKKADRIYCSCYRGSAVRETISQEKTKELPEAPLAEAEQDDAALKDPGQEKDEKQNEETRNSGSGPDEDENGETESDSEEKL